MTSSCSSNERDATTNNNKIVKVVVGIITHRNKILVAQRRPEQFMGGYWEFPGGKIEKNETPLQALKRELKEEIGIDVMDATFWSPLEHTYPDRKVILNMSHVTAYQGEPAGCEGQIIQWCSYQQLNSINFLPGNKQILSLLTQKLALS